MSSELFLLRWNNHQSNLIDVFSKLLEQDAFVDVSISCNDGSSFSAHRLVLSACSNYFQEILVNLPCEHPVIILKDVSPDEMEALLKFMYKGEVNVAQSDLSSLLNLAKCLQIKGLADVTSDAKAQAQILCKSPNDKTEPKTEVNLPIKKDDDNIAGDKIKKASEKPSVIPTSDAPPFGLQGIPPVIASHGATVPNFLSSPNFLPLHPQHFPFPVDKEMLGQVFPPVHNLQETKEKLKVSKLIKTK